MSVGTERHRQIRFVVYKTAHGNGASTKLWRRGGKAEEGVRA